MAAVGEDQIPVLALLSRLTRPFNISGVPTASVPCGFTSAGLPIGLQIAGRAFEQATDWGNRRPPV